MDPTSLPLDPDPKPFIPNGSLKKHSAAAYRECLRNHAAASGGHILDGCGEFMPLPSATPADPSSLKCAACGCHRNFHRRTTQQLTNHHPTDNSDSDDDQDNSGSPQPYFSSAPQMLLALSTATAPVRPITKPVEYSLDIPRPASAAPPRKRFRTKFSAEQKGRMHALSEKIGWRMQKRADNLVEEGCKEIGVGRGVFKVWMHNNKHNYVSPRRVEVGSSSSSGGAGAGAVPAEVVKVENVNGGGAGGSLGHMVNGASSS